MHMTLALTFRTVKVKYKYANQKTIHDFIFDGNGNVFYLTFLGPVKNIQSLFFFETIYCRQLRVLNGITIWRSFFKPCSSWLVLAYACKCVNFKNRFVNHLYSIIYLSKTVLCQDTRNSNNLKLTIWITNVFA